MSIEYLKKATKKSSTGEDQTRETVTRILKEIEENGEKLGIRPIRTSGTLKALKK